MQVNKHHSVSCWLLSHSRDPAALNTARQSAVGISIAHIGDDRDETLINVHVQRRRLTTDNAHAAKPGF